MKNFLLSLLFVVCSVALVNAATPSSTATLNTSFELVAKSTGTTTVTGTTAATLLTKQRIERGYEYVLVTRDSIGAAADSAAYRAIVYGDDNTTAMGTVVLGWALTANANTCNLVPIGSSLFGKSFSITFTRAEATNKSAVYRWELYKRRALTVQQDWNVTR